MIQKVPLAAVLVALVAPMVAALCQWQCHFMPDSGTAFSVSAAAPAEHRMECCAAPQTELKKPIPELGSRTTIAKSLETPGRISPADFHRLLIIHESPPGLESVLSSVPSSPNLRI